MNGRNLLRRETTGTSRWTAWRAVLVVAGASVGLWAAAIVIVERVL